MNAYKIGSILIVGIFASIASAAEQQQQDSSTATTFPSTQESAALQTIRWRVAASCYQNTDCAARAASGVDGRRTLRSPEPSGESPSTPERRRALGLTKEQENQR